MLPIQGIANPEVFGLLMSMRVLFVLPLLLTMGYGASPGSDEEDGWRFGRGSVETESCGELSRAFEG
jgi:hypothetical protein